MTRYDVNLIVWACVPACFCCVIVPYVYWFEHPELTQMQMMQSQWPWFACGLAVGAICIWLDITKKGGKR